MNGSEFAQSIRDLADNLKTLNGLEGFVAGLGLMGINIVAMASLKLVLESLCDLIADLLKKLFNFLREKHKRSKTE